MTEVDIGLKKRDGNYDKQINKQLTMLLLQAVVLDLVGLVLRLLLDTAGARGVHVLLLALLLALVRRQLADGRHGVDGGVEAVGAPPENEQLGRVGRGVVAIAAAGLTCCGREKGHDLKGLQIKT